MTGITGRKLLTDFGGHNGTVLPTLLVRELQYLWARTSVPTEGLNKFRPTSLQPTGLSRILRIDLPARHHWHGLVDLPEIAYMQKSEERS